MSAEFDRASLSQKQATAERYHRALTPEVIQYLSDRGISRDVADQFLLGVCDDIHQGWLSIPYLRPSGTVHFNFRNLTGGSPKYASPGKKHLYNTGDLDIADTTGEVCICEGELDTIIASAVFGVPSVGVPGATQWTGNKHWHELFRGYQRVWMLADPDDAGLSMAAAVLDTLPQARLVRLPGDVNETYLRGEDLRSYLK